MAEDKLQFNFFNLPTDLQLEILSHADLKDILSFESTCKEAELLVSDDYLWKKKLWIDLRAVFVHPHRVGLENISRFAGVIIKNSYVNHRSLYASLNTSSISKVTENSEIDNNLERLGNIYRSLAATDSPKFLTCIFPCYKMENERIDPFEVGWDAPTFVLFGPPETKTAKQFIYCMIASKNSNFEPVGLKQMLFGGFGGGMTVKQNGCIMNFCPLRRARLYCLTEGEGESALFNPKIVEMVKGTNGLIYYFDAVCNCENVSRDCTHHNIDNEFMEFKAMLRSLPKECVPPLLIFLIKGEETSRLHHKPCDLIPYLQNIKNAWMVCSTSFPSLQSMQVGLNWLLNEATSAIT